MDTLPSISAIILTLNEEQMIANCLETLKWCDEIIVVDSGSTDMTLEIAERAGATVVTTKENSFAERRNAGLKKARSEWVLYIDADERVSPQLAQEMQEVVQRPGYAAFAVRRNNIHYGKWLKHGGWEQDWVERLFKKSSIEHWSGQVHESPHFTGASANLTHPLAHLTHRNMVDGLRKTIDWTGFEAQLLFEGHHAKVTVITLVRKSIMEFFRRVFLKKGYKDGIEGWIEGMTQAMNKFIVYERLWELQRTPQLDDTYRKIDETIVAQWHKKQKKGHS